MSKFKIGDVVAVAQMQGTIQRVGGEDYTILWDGEDNPRQNTRYFIDREAVLVTSTEGRDLTKPDYYVDGRKHEPFDVINDWQLSFALGNVVKYISRCGRKTADPIPDLEKARVYLDMEITRLKGLND